MYIHKDLLCSEGDLPANEDLNKDTNSTTVQSPATGDSL